MSVAMGKLRFIVSLTTNENDYQLEQAASAEVAARHLDIELQIIYAENDTILQSQQLLKIIQSSSESRPDGIIFEPVGGTALPVVARAAAEAGIGWVVMNREIEYLNELRKSARVPIFSVSSDHEEIGRIQGRQFAALLPKGGTVLYIQGPSMNLATINRTIGMQETKPTNIEIKAIRGNWTEASAYKAVGSWLKLSTSRQSKIDIVAAQNDTMAVGAKKAFQELLQGKERERWLRAPFLGIDGVPQTGQAWVRAQVLSGTIISPPNTTRAIDMLVSAIKTGDIPPERTYTIPQSFPDIQSLGSKKVQVLC
ncbi:MAG TPA: substrate-binding domain-containing protein [Terriglobales bacterium]|jgi:ribose transport system substrate-binding protein